ncbi:MAG: hypothetical protein EXR47_08235 [Dehalococcoidia bacterium]|nr:hypothetical protein [Dehalococcoidia bacterium]
MTRKRVGGFIFVTYKGDHGPPHVHIYQGHRHLGKWDIKQKKPMGTIEVTSKLKAALKQAGYLEE